MPWLVFSKFDSRYCRKDSLDSNLVKGKIVLCDELSNGESVFLSGVCLQLSLMAMMVIKL